MCSLYNSYGSMMKGNSSNRLKSCSAHVKGQNVHCACSVSRDLWVGDQKQPHTWNPGPIFAYSLYNFHRATMTIKGSLQVKILLLAIFGRKFSKSVFGPNFRLWGLFQGVNINFNFSNPQKAHPCVRPRRLSYRA